MWKAFIVHDNVTRSDRIPRWLRATLLALSVALILETLGVSATQLVHWPYVNPPVSTPADLVTLVVAPHSAAERAGLRTGDRVDLRQMTPVERFRFYDYAWVGNEDVRLPVTRGGVPLTARFRVDPLPRTLLNVTTLLLGPSFALLVLVLGALVLARWPTVDAALFWGFVSGSWAVFSAPSAPIPVAMGLQFIGDVAQAWWLGPMVLLAVGPRPLREQLLPAVLGLWLVLGIGTLAVDLRVVFGGVAPPPVVQWLIASFALNYFSYMLCIVAVIAGTLQSHGALRVRYQWMTAGFAAYIGATMYTTIIGFEPQLTSDALGLAQQILSVIGICFFAYTIVRHDLYGIGFVVNRAAVYTALTAVIVGLFGGGNWIVGSALKASGFALPVDIVLAVAAGLSLHLVQRRVTVVVDRIFFRRRYEATRRLRSAARALSQVGDGRLVAEALVVEPTDALLLFAAAYFARRSDGTFQLAAHRNWPIDAQTAIDARDPLVLHLAGTSEDVQSMDDLPSSHAFPQGVARPRTVVLLWSGHELRGFAFYSAHRSGATLDPEETAMLERLALAASAAIGRIAAAELQSALDELAALRAENERLKLPATLPLPLPITEH